MASSSSGRYLTASGSGIRSKRRRGLDNEECVMGSPGDKLREQLAKGKKAAKKLKEGAKPSKEAPAKAKKNGAAKGASAKPAKKIARPGKKAEKKVAKSKVKVPVGEKARINDRDRKGDGLRPVERKLLKLIDKHGPISVLNLAQKHFRSKEIPREGPDSVRTIRNAMRKPIEYGMLAWAGRGIIDMTPLAKKSGVEKAAQRYQRKAVKEVKAEAKPKKVDKKGPGRNRAKKAGKQASV